MAKSSKDDRSMSLNDHTPEGKAALREEIRKLTEAIKLEQRKLEKLRVRLKVADEKQKGSQNHSNRDGFFYFVNWR